MKRSIVVLFLLVLATGPVLADTTYVEIGSPYIKNAIPFWGDVHDACRLQLLYLQSEIDQAGTIVAFGLCCTEDAPSWFRKVRVKLCHTPASSLVSTFQANYGGNTPQTILSADSLLVGTGQNLTWYYFPSDFVYNNTDNLLLEITWRGDEGRRVRVWRNPNGADRRCHAMNDTAVSGTVDDVEAYYARIGFTPTGATEPREIGLMPLSFNVTPTHGRAPFRISGSTLLAGKPELTIWDPTGRLVERLNPVLNQGRLEARWNATGIPAGVYLCRLQSGASCATRVLTLMR